MNRDRLVVLQVKRNLFKIKRFAVLEEAPEILMDHACGRSGGGNGVQSEVKDDIAI